MYENDNYKIQINWQSLIIKVALVVLAILLIIWLFPMPKLDTFYNRVYNENLNSMKTVAENYFVGDKLPSETGASTTLKLQDMLDKKIITDFVDKDNNSCNTTNSYAQVTKTNDNYVLKVQLSCDEKTDYVLENINISNAKATNSDKNNNSNTENNNSNNSNGNNNDNNSNNNNDDDILYDKDINSDYDKDAAIIEYEYKKAITKSTTAYTCPDGYVKENNICYKYETGETIKAKALYFDDIEEVTKAKKNTTGEYTVNADAKKEEAKREKVCPTGYTLNNDICYKYVEATAKPGTTTYSCKEGKLDGTKCIIETSPVTKTGESIYSCKEGKLDGTKCVIEATPTKNTKDSLVYYTCDNGGTLNGNKCYTYSYANKTCSTSESYYTCDLSGGNRQSSSSCSYGAKASSNTSCSSCPSGYNESGTTCVGYRYEYVNLVDNSYWSNPVNKTYSTAQQTGTIGNLRRTYVNHSCTARACTYTYAESYKVSKYSCPSGYAQVGSTCAKAVQDIKYRSCNTTTSYSCPNGGNLSGSTCYYQGTYHGGSTSCSCPSGYSDKNGSCVKESSYNATAHNTSGETYYTCPSGYTQSGTGSNTKCTKTVDATKNTGKTEYTCPTGYDKSGEGENTKCTKKIDATANTSETQYSCPSGYVKKGTTCYTYTDVSEKVEYKYTCPEGYDKSGEGENTKCTKKIKSKTTYYCEDDDAKLVDDKCIKTIEGGIKGYECPAGYVQSNDKCVKKTTTCMPAEQITNTYTSYEYQWSTSTSLDGWTRTGKTRNKGTTSTKATTTKTNTNSYEK